jgi:hypothetical protein|mmetsp:Transcript_28345/g.45523  ORF Transcript_28345/g.45523 Transcript_28345/m.45523 type:complete len:897 (-) Transcript_28345:69-2759(-)
MLSVWATISFLPLVLSLTLNGGSNSSDSRPLALSIKTVAVGAEVESIQELEHIFARSKEVHDHSLDEISKTLTIEKAIEVLQQEKSNNSALNQVLSMVSEGHIGKTALRKKKQDPSGYSGLDGARTLLNEMIYESLSKYDAEIAKCTDFYSKQCALMEVCRGQIAASNFVAANSRALILDAQANINKCEEDIPETKLQLKQHQLKCENELTKLNTRLKIVMGDVAVMTMILKMTDCETEFLQMKKLAMLRCKNTCTNNTYVTFNHKGLHEQMSKLHSKAAQELLRSTFSDMFDGSGGMHSVQLVQVEGSDYMAADPAPDDKPKDVNTITNKTEFNNPPVPVTKVPGNPCIDPNKGAPSPEDKRAAKCTIKKSPQCYKLQSRFLQIQGGIQDEADQLKDDIAQLESFCDETSKTLETTIANDQSMLASQQTKLAAATEKEANAGEEARQTSKQNEQLNADLRKQMKKCSDNYIQFETELCALKKIRGELYKMKGDGHTGFFQDCEVAKWDPEECTKKCAGGEQKLSRAVLTHPNGGSKCLPLTAIRSCNNGPCPVDCVLLQWTGWSKCSADCGGGVTQRLRDVKKAMRYGGKPCSSTSETKACNAAACEKDCELSDWTEWTVCSKDCDGGSRKRSKFVQHPAEGSGKCAGQWDVSRLEYKSCNMHRCKVNDVTKALPCNRSMDVILLIDACPKSGEEGYAAEMKAANLIVDAFNPQKTNIAIVQYCGPRTWSGVSVCTGKSTGAIDTEKVCKVKLAQHFSTDIAKTKAVLNGLEYMKGEKLLEMALLSAEAELALGNKDAHATVIAFLDGSPLSPRKTRMAAEKIRKKARLLWITVTKFSPLKNIKLWSTRRWQENIVKVTDTTQLAQAATATHVIANICPDEFPKLNFSPKRDSRR